MKQLKKIKSFQVDHRKLQAGFYVSRRDHVLSNNCHDCVTTFDLRFFATSEHCYLTQSGLHTIEHLGATFLRPSWQQDHLFWPDGLPNWVLSGSGWVAERRS